MLCFAFLALCLAFASCENQKVLETERLRNTPPALTSADEIIPIEADSEIQPRFIPFSASFSVSAGGNNAQTFSIAGSPTGIGLSQSGSHSVGSPVHGNPGAFSTSQSSSIAAGLNGISASESNSVASNHPLYGPHSQTNSNSFALGQATALSHGDVINGQAVSNAQSSAGGTHSQASSSAISSVTQNYRPERPGWSYSQPGYANGYDGDYYYNSQRPSNGRPKLHVTVTDDRHQLNQRPSGGWYEVSDNRNLWRNPDYCNYYNGWYRDPRCRNPRVTITKPGNNYRDRRQKLPSVHISSASSGSSAQSGPGGFAVGQSSSETNHGNQGSSSSTSSVAQSSGSAQSHAHGTSGTIHLNQHTNKHQASVSSSSASTNSKPGGFSQSNSHSSSSAGNSNSHANSLSSGSASAHASAHAGSTVIFPGPSHQSQIIPSEFVRSKKPKKDDDPLDDLLTDITDTVYDIFDF